MKPEGPIWVEVTGGLVSRICSPSTQLVKHNT